MKSKATKMAISTDKHNKRMTTDAIEILNRVILKNDPKRLEKVEYYRLNSEVAGLIYNLRTKAGLSQAELAKKINTTQSVISRLEDADYDGHSLSMLAKIAAVLNHRLVLRAQKLDLPKVNSKSKIAARTQKLARA
jgi:ribosome-binding protein aMBF1 (putative translation factor)